MFIQTLECLIKLNMKNYDIHNDETISSNWILVTFNFSKFFVALASIKVDNRFVLQVSHVFDLGIFSLIFQVANFNILH